MLSRMALFAFEQSRISAEVARAFLNIEPLVGAIAGVVAFGTRPASRRSPAAWPSWPASG
ncbi:MAG TPA: hypothetical protein VF482_21850 [Trebonia sp.]